jgi:MinD superfamily P-loop ATPase
MKLITRVYSELDEKVLSNVVDALAGIQLPVVEMLNVYTYALVTYT